MSEKEIIDKIQSMCEESLSPELFFNWEEIKLWLVKNRKIN